MDPKELQSWLRARVAESAGISPSEIDPNESFFTYGVESLSAVRISGELEELLGRELPETLLYEYPTVDAVCAYLAGDVDPGLRAAPRASPGAPTSRDPIAIVGIGCRFPGARGPLQYWELLRTGTHAVREVPEERWDAERFYDPRPGTPGKTNSKWGGFIDAVDRFDHAFFGISRAEANWMDPQQRHLLEVTWEALEDAGIPPAKLAGTRTGVFMGLSSNEYLSLQLRDLERISVFTGTGNAYSIAANRISYLLDLRGPSLSVDTACSASLVALHLACESISSGASDVALAGGVSLMLTPAFTINLSMGAAASPTGRCAAFSSAADGVVRGEGAGVVVLKRASRAIADGDRIYAVVRGSAVGQDGRTNGIVAPSRLAQEAILEDACRDAGVAPRDLQYVECHGTGTPLGDAIECRALGAVVGTGRPLDRPCAIGSVKTNLGHLEGAAGIAGVIKLALSIFHGKLPPSLHSEPPNPSIPFRELGLRVNDTLAAWSHPSRLAGVSGFGFGGTNAHLVLSAAPPQAPVDATPEGRAELVCVSARSSASVREAAAQLVRMIDSGAELALGAVARSTTRGRDHHSVRAAVVASTLPELRRGLSALAAGGRDARLAWRPDADSRRDRPRTAFVFSGHGAQWWGMGQALLRDFEVFADLVERCDETLRPLAGWSVRSELERGPGESRVVPHEIEIGQVALFVVQVGLAGVLRDWGIVPDAVVGHSVGEVAAAHVAGALSLEDALRVVFARSRLLQDAVDDAGDEAGGLLAVEASPSSLSDILGVSLAGLTLAARNAPESVVLAGCAADLEVAAERFAAAGIHCGRLAVPGAAHSPRVAPLCANLLRATSDVAAEACRIPFYSTVTGCAEATPLDAAYWARNLLAPVLFDVALSEALHAGYGIFVELGPHPTLAGSIRTTSDHLGLPALVVRSQSQFQESRETLLRLAAALYVQGFDPDWRAVVPHDRPVSSLPPYPWRGERCWFEEGHPGLRESGGHAVDHPLLGRFFRNASSRGQRIWESELSVERFPFLADHRVADSILVPSTFYVALALAAARQRDPAQPTIALRDVRLEQVLFLEPGEVRCVQLVLTPGALERESFEIFSGVPVGRSDEVSWVRHASGLITHGGADSELASAPEPAIDDCVEAVTVEDHYRRMAEWNVAYGPSFRRLRSAFRGPGRGQAEVSNDDDPLFEIHPTVLDACLQVGGLAIPDELRAATDLLCLPVGIDALDFRATRSPMLSCRASATGAPRRDEVQSDTTVRTTAGDVALRVRGFRIRRLDVRELTRKRRVARDSVYELRWRDVGAASPSPAPSHPEGRWLVLADRHGYGCALVRRLSAEGCAAVTVQDLAEWRAAIDGDLPVAVIHMWSLDLPGPGDGVGREDAVDAVLALREVYATMPAGAPLFVVTEGAQAVEEGDAVAPMQALTWGFVRAAQMERSEVVTRLVDLGREEPASAAERLIAELRTPPREGQLALRGERRLAPRLVHMALPVASEPIRCDPDGTYLVTGGLGGLGLATAAWLAQRGARDIVLTGRRALPGRERWADLAEDTGWGEALGGLAQLESLGAEVRYESIDAADTAGMLRLIQRLPRLRGVVCAAGTVEPRALANLAPPVIENCLGPKVWGAWALHEATLDRDLEFFVVYSSAAALWGSSGLAHYSAANHFMDALVAHRRASGRPALTIDWGMWGGVGMASSREFEVAASLIGLRPLAPDEALCALDLLLAERRGQACVASADWDEFRALYERDAPHRRLLVELRSDLSAAGSAERSGVLRRELAGMSRDAGVARLSVELRTHIAAGLGIEPDALDPERTLGESGIDSLFALELKNRFESELGVKVPVGVLLGGPSVDGLAAQLWALVEGEGGGERVDLRSEAILAPEISAEGTARTSVQRPEQAFVTGATGFIGATLVEQLIARSDLRLVCLVRAPDEGAAKERLLRSLEQFAPIPREQAHRLIAIPGDLGRDQFGLSATKFDWLARTTQVIYHAGAWLNPVYDYHDLREVNVGGTERVIRLAFAQSPKALHYVSSLAIFPWDRPGACDEVACTDPVGLPDGYCQTKWVAEQLVVEAARRGLPATIYRPGLVTGNSQTGASNLEDLLSRVLKGSIQLGCAPDLEIDVSLTPVDYVAGFIAAASMHEGEPERFYHLVNREAASWSELLDVIRESGHPIEVLPFEDWKERLFGLGDELSQNVLHYLLPLFDLPVEQLNRRREFHFGNAARAAERLGLSCAIRSTALLSAYIGSYRDQGFLPQPESPRARASSTSLMERHP